MGNLRIVQIDNQDERFYPLMGPFLSRREIVKELGFPVWDEDGKVWFIAMSGQKVAGFAAVRVERENAVFCSAYVMPEFRKQKVYDALMAARMEYAASHAKTASAVVTAAARGTWKRFGFTAKKGTMKRYTKMSKVLA